jgi:hypothetical protein
MTPTHYKIVPISEKPEKDGWHYVTTLPILDPFMVVYSTPNWFIPPNVADRFTHWLKPVEGILMTEEELETMVNRAYREGEHDGLRNGNIRE